jgi:hypothetical protein
MNLQDEKLSSLLREWKAPEPSTGFEMRVRRRLHEIPPRASWRDWLQPAPALSAIAAILVAALIGISSASRPATTGIFDRDTISGQYIQLVSGDSK